MSLPGPAAEQHLVDAIRAAMRNVRERRTWPFGAVITRGGTVIATAVNEVDALCDPSAMPLHALPARDPADEDLYEAWKRVAGQA